MIQWLRLSARNGARRKLRTGVTALGIAVAVAALFSLLSFQKGYQQAMAAELDRLGAHILVVPKGCPYDAASIALHGASWPCYLKEHYAAYVKRSAYVAAAAPLLMNAVYDQTNGDQVVYIGATPELLSLKRSWRIEGRFPRKGDDCLVGAAVAAKRRLCLGERFTLEGLKHESGRVSGILQPTQGADDGFIYVTLAHAQEIFHRPEQITHVLVRLTDPDRLDEVVSTLRGCEAGLDMNIVPLSHLFKTIQGIVDSTRSLLASAALLALLVAGAGVSNTVLMAVSERTREIGVMRAVGASASDIFRLIWLETIEICLVGGVGGLVIAALGAGALEQWLRGRLPFAPTGALVQMQPAIMLASLAGAAAIGSVAGLLPAWRAARHAPVEAMRA